MEIIEENPLNYAHISEMQQVDNKLLAMQQQNLKNTSIKVLMTISETLYVM